MKQMFLAFARMHETDAYKEARSPWLCLPTLQCELNTTPAPDLPMLFKDIPLYAWQGSYDVRYNGWRSEKAAERGERTDPDHVYELLFLSEKAVRGLTREQATLMVNELSRETMTSVTWQQEADRAAAILGFRPSSPGAARTHYRRGQKFMDYLEELASHNKPDDPRLLKFEFNPRLHDPEPKLQDRPTGAMRELAVPVEDSPAQQLLRARRGGGRNRQAFIEQAYLRMMAAKRAAKPQ